MDVCPCRRSTSSSSSGSWASSCSVRSSRSSTNGGRRRSRFSPMQRRRGNRRLQRVRRRKRRARGSPPAGTTCFGRQPRTRGSAGRGPRLRPRGSGPVARRGGDRNALDPSGGRSRRLRPLGQARRRHRRQAASAPADSARIDGFVEGLAKALASLPPPSRNGIGSDGAPRLSAPRPLTPEETQSCRDAFAGALGRPLDFVVAVDPGLIAGLELETPHVVVHNSFRNDLARVVEELTRHDRVPG